MTFEHRIIVELADIRGISLECDKCTYRITMPPDSIGEIPTKCSAGHEWSIGEKIPNVQFPVLAFTDALAKLRTLIGQKAYGFKVLLEFDDPKATRSISEK